ncbi:MAG: molybdate ABC transporter substrate-binding protein [Lachnospiraceae bacterium]|jgi:molybdate transport system substrate-binding protein
MKKFIALILSAAFAVCMLAACGTQEGGNTTIPAPAEDATQPGTEAETEVATEAVDSPSGELIVFAAASMTETLTEIGDIFMILNPDVKVVFNFDSSGTLKTQIQEGADCDVFISAGQKQMNQLDINADKEVNTEGLDFVISGTRFDLLENKVVLAVPDGNPKGIESFEKLCRELLPTADGVKLAIGNADVPVGQYTQKIFKYFEIELSDDTGEPVDATILANISYGSNVKEVTTQVTENTVDCGVVYATDAFSAGLEWVDEATKDMCGQVIYPAAVLNTTKNEDAARAFLGFIISPRASEVLEKVGFTPLN